MSTEADAQAPRRSARDRKQFAPIPLASDKPSKKRKRVSGGAGDGSDGDEGAGSGDEAQSGDEGGEADADNDSDVDSEPEAKSKRKRASAANKKPAAAGAGKKTAGAARPKAGAPARKGKKAAGLGEDGVFDHAQVAKATRITDDNALFNTILNPAAALQSTAEDFLDSYQQTQDVALAELVTCILRCSGCNATIDRHEAVDLDGVEGKLDDISAVLLKETAPPYPLVSRLAVFKKFRKSLGEFINRLVRAASDLGVLLDDEFIPTLQMWLMSMASTKLRSFRHTGTVIAMDLQTALTQVAVAADKDAETLVRQKDAEKKKKGTGRASAREKELEQKSKEANDGRAKIKEFMKDIFEGVFVHRFRDNFAEIREECMRALGSWLKTYPAHFLSGTYLRYVGWMLSDTEQPVRHEAVKSLVALYAKDDYIVTLRNFTERFKGRLLEMATSDIDFHIRVASIQVLSTIDSHSLLDDDQRDRLCLLVFDVDQRVRKAISVFVRGIWNEDVESRMAGHKETEKTQARAGVKALAVLLTGWARAVPKAGASVTGRADDGADAEDDSESSDKQTTAKKLALLVQPLQKGRLAYAVDALYDEISAISDWETLLELLLLDHSAEGEVGASTTPSRRKKNAAPAEDTVDPAWRLDEAEESCVLEVFVASLRKTIADSKKGDGDSVQTDITRTLITALPRLFAKYQSDARRICDVLVIPQLLSLELFLEMRVISSYEALWDDVNKQFNSSANPTVLNHAMDTIRHLLSTTSLSNTNSQKILELEDELSSSLREVIGGRDDLETAMFSDDEVHALTAIALRVSMLFGFRDMTAWMEEDEGGKQSSAWDILIAVAERGGLGYKEEDQLVEQCLQVLASHVIWKARRFTGNKFAEESNERRLLKEQRNALLAKVTEFTVGQVSKPCENVARAAFQHLLTLHVLFGPAVHPPGTEPTELHLTMDDETQYRCAGFIQAEIEKYADETKEEREVAEDKSDASDAGSGSETEAPNNKAKKPKAAKDADKPAVAAAPSAARLEHEYATVRLLSSFLASMSAGVINVKHAPVLLAHYGHLEPSFDQISKRAVETLRQEGLERQNGEVVTAVVVQALKDAFNLYFDDSIRSDAPGIALAKALAPAFIKRGELLRVVARVPGEHLVAVHTRSISWIIKQIQTHEVNKNARSKRKALVFFRMLAPLTVAIESRDALKIKAHMDQAFSLAKVEPGVAKEWDPLRAYERRLSNKDKTITISGKPKRARGAKADGATTDEEIDGDPIEDPDVEKPKKPARKRAAPRKSRASRKSGTDEDDEAEFAGRVDVSAPRRRSARKINGKASGSEPELSEPELELEGSEQEEEDEVMDVAPAPKTNGTHSPAKQSPSKKRRRPDDEPEQEEEAAAEAPQELSEYKSRRKRARAAL